MQRQRSIERVKEPVDKPRRIPVVEVEMCITDKFVYVSYNN